MPRITHRAVTDYLHRIYGKPVRILSLTREGAQEAGDDLKGFGYGSPLFLEYDVAGDRKKAVLETMAPSSFGHDHFADRAQAILWEHSAFNALPRHVRSLDCGAILDDGTLLSTGHAEEFFSLTEFVQGDGYFKDLERIRDRGVLEEPDAQRAVALADYLVEIHGSKGSPPQLYTRRIRDLIGHGECIMGLIDNYPERFEFIDAGLLKKIEFACVEWRWKIKDRSHRLSQVHGDFHPWNILFRGGTDFTVLDRSRGEWGEPADDVATMTLNYLFFGLQHGSLDGPFATLFSRFWETYLTRTGDREMLEVIAPFYAWRGLVVASPVWYPHLPASVRKRIFDFIINVLASGRFEPPSVQEYFR